MKNTKAIKLLQSLSKKETKKFIEFVDSPYFNKNSDIKKFVNYLLKYYPVFPEKKIEKQAIYKHLYPEQKYSDQRMRDLISDILSLCERFLGLTNFETEDLNQEISILNELRKRNLHSIFQCKVNETRKKIDAMATSSSVNYFKYRHLLEEEKILSQMARINIVDLKSENEFEFDPLRILRAHGEFSILMFFKYINLIKVLQIKFNTKIEGTDESKIDNLYYSLTTTVGENNIIKLYYLIHKLDYTSNNQSYYLECKRISLSASFTTIDPEHQKYVLNVLANYCNQMINMGFYEYNHDAYEIYQRQLELKLCFDGNNVVNPLFFRNIVKLGLQLHDDKWLESFIEEYVDSLDKEVKEDTINLCYALLYFYRQEFTKALSYAGKFNQRVYSSKQDYKEITLKTYFELRDFDSCYYTIDNYRHFLKNNLHIPVVLRDRHKNFIKHVEYLLKNKIFPHTYNANELKNYYNSLSNSPSPKWLEQKYDELLESKKNKIS